MSIVARIYLIFLLIGYYVYTLPVRAYRIIKEPFLWFYEIVKFGRFVQQTIISFLSILVLLADLLGIPELMMITFSLIKKSLRPLSSKEQGILMSSLAESLPAQLLHINNTADMLTRKGKFAFVSFLFIHAHGAMKDSTFAHELIHIWQYTRFGSKYIILALFAQRSKEGYNYFGESHLMETYANGGDIMQYNFEQQGEILADYYRLLTRKSVLQASTYAHKHFIYNHFVESIKSMKIYRW